MRSKETIDSKRNAMSHHWWLKLSPMSIVDSKCNVRLKTELNEDGKQQTQYSTATLSSMRTVVSKHNLWWVIPDDWWQMTKTKPIQGDQYYVRCVMSHHRWLMTNDWNRVQPRRWTLNAMIDWIPARQKQLDKSYDKMLTFHPCEPTNAHTLFEFSPGRQ